MAKAISEMAAQVEVLLEDLWDVCWLHELEGVLSNDNFA